MGNCWIAVGPSWRTNVLPNRPLKTIICIQHEPTRTRCVQLLGELQAIGQLSEKLPRYTVEVAQCNQPDEVLQLLHRHFDGSFTNPVILISDLLAETHGSFPNEDPGPTQWAKEILHEFDDCLLGTIAIMDKDRRVPDIDRAVRQTFDAEALLNTFTLVADKLTYITRPDRSVPAGGIGSVAVRQIKNPGELQTYFELRYRVYRLMGYLDEQVESADSAMEIDAGDTHALPIGAFATEGAREKLVGTARMVSLEPMDNRYDSWTRSLAETDPVLKRQIYSFDQLRLPIFQSQKLSDTLVDVLTKDLNCGELSRVIVSEDYRGRGISELLVWFAVLQAAQKNVSRLFLECLPIHEPLYEKFGFQRMAGVAGRVIGVGKTMIAMELSHLTVEELQQKVPVGRFLQFVRSRDCLLSCHTELCTRAECDLYTKGKCPLR
jgi:GNAT superfamily N-acetyltransferase